MCFLAVIHRRRRPIAVNGRPAISRILRIVDPSGASVRPQSIAGSGVRWNAGLLIGLLEEHAEATPPRELKHDFMQPTGIRTREEDTMSDEADAKRVSQDSDSKGNDDSGKKKAKAGDMCVGGLCFPAGLAKRETDDSKEGS